MEDLRGGQWKEVSEVKPVKAGENKKKETNPDGNRSVETNPEGDRISKNRSTESGSGEYESEWKPIQPKDDRARPIQKKIKVAKDKEEAKERHYHGQQGPSGPSGFEDCFQG